MRITLKQLAVFEAVASYGQVAKAAEHLNLSSPATSMALAELEKQLDIRLFERRSNKLTLNAHGQLLLPLAVDALQSVDQIEHAFINQNQKLRGTLTITASSTIGNYLLAPATVAFCQHYPDTNVQLNIGNTQDVIQAVTEGRSELGFIEGLCLDRRLTVDNWQIDELDVFCHPSHPLAGKTVKADALKHENWILREEGSGTREVFIHAAMALKLHPKVMFSFTRPEAIKQAVLQGGGIGVLSNLTLVSELARGELQQIFVQGLSLNRQLYHICHNARSSSALGHAYNDFCDNWIQKNNSMFVRKP